ncbi:hypothetical protein BYT27DRAFT_7247104 [Phlegmacium glaucopus]|nr:hypothetical protein BYT27DRAFT_7247104 [Phlegmacium glaucopus]
MHHEGVQIPERMAIRREKDITASRNAAACTGTLEETPYRFWKVSLMFGALRWTRMAFVAATNIESTISQMSVRSEPFMALGVTSGRSTKSISKILAYFHKKARESLGIRHKNRAPSASLSFPLSLLLFDPNSLPPLRFPSKFWCVSVRLSIITSPIDPLLSSTQDTRGFGVNIKEVHSRSKSSVQRSIASRSADFGTYSAKTVTPFLHVDPNNFEA